MFIPVPDFVSIPDPGVKKALDPKGQQVTETDPPPPTYGLINYIDKKQNFVI
jgi:hypothetical protein